MSTIKRTAPRSGTSPHPCPGTSGTGAPKAKVTAAPATQKLHPPQAVPWDHECEAHEPEEEIRGRILQAEYTR